MATLQYRGSIVGNSEAVVKPSIASYRGTTYNPQEVSSKANKFTMSYRGTTLEV